MALCMIGGATASRISAGAAIKLRAGGDEDGQLYTDPHGGQYTSDQGAINPSRYFCTF